MTYAQLDRMEHKMDLLRRGIEEIINGDAEEVLRDFFDEVIMKENGELNHLSKDEKVVAFFQKFKQNDGDEEEKDEDNEYRQP